MSYGQNTNSAKLAFAWKGGMQADWTTDIRTAFRPYEPRGPRTHEALSTELKAGEHSVKHQVEHVSQS